MAIEIPSSTDDTQRRRVVGMRCRNCGATQPIGLSYVCPACFGPLEVAYDYAVVGATLTREAIAARAPGIWRYAELLPSTRRRRAGCRSARRRCWPPIGWRRTLGLDRLLDQGRHPQPVAVASRTGRSRSPRPGPSSSASRRSPARRPATWPGRPRPPRRPSGCRPTSSSRPTSSRPRSTTRWPTARRSSRSTGTYDDVNRLCLEVADETGWGFVNINLRPFYAEGSKTLAYEIAESLGWRSPDVVVAPVASGAMFTRVARGFEELAELGLIERRPIRFVGGQAAGCAPGRDGVGGRDRRHRAGPDAGHDRPLAGHRQPGRRPLRGRAGQRDRRLGRGDRRRGDRRGDPRRRAARGHLPGDGRRRDPGRGRRRPAPRRHPARRRGRRPADRQRAQDAGRADARARRRRRPARRSRVSRRRSGRACRRSSAGWAARHEHGPHPADAAGRDRRREAGRGPGRDGPRGRGRRSSPLHPGLESQLHRRRTATSTASSTRSSTTPTSATSQALDTPVGERRHARPAAGDGRRLAT